jgi:MFS family permease
LNNALRAAGPISSATPIVLRIVVCGVLFDALIPLSPFIVESFGIGFGDFQRILSMGFLIFSGTQFLAPRFANAGEPEQLLLVSTLGVAALCGMLALPSNFWGFSLILLLMFSANAVGSVSARTSLRGLLDSQRFEKALSSSYSLMSAGAVLTPILVVAVATRLHWKWLVLLPSMVLCGLCFFLPRSTRGRRERTEAPDASSRKVGAFTRIVRKKEFHIPLLMGMAAQSLFAAVLISKPSILVGQFKMAPSTLGAALAFTAAVEVLAFHLSGKAAGRFGWQRRICAAWGFLALGILALLASAYADSVALFLAFAVMVVVFFCIVLPISATLALDVAPDERFHAAALYGGIQSLGGASIVFLLSALPGSPVAALIILAVLVWVGMPGLQFALHRPTRQAHGG